MTDVIVEVCCGILVSNFVLIVKGKDNIILLYYLITVSKVYYFILFLK